MENEWVFIGRSETPAETKRMASTLASLVQAGDVVLLTGDLGAGKTQFAQGFAAGLGAAEVVVSPTFNIVLSYLSGRLPLHHFDLYRLDEPSQLEDIALREYLESDGVCLVEWAEKFPDAFDGCLSVRFEKESDEARELWATAGSERAKQLLDSWQHACAGEARRDAVSADACADAVGARTDAAELPADAGAHDVGASALPAPTGVVDATERFMLALDTANEVVAIALARIDAQTQLLELVSAREIQAHRASNTTLVPAIDELLGEIGVARSQIACVCAGRGPGSFTGVRIALATAKGIAQALGVGLIGVSTLDAIAWAAQVEGCRGNLLVVADAMRKEVYPVRYALFDDGVRRLSADRVVKADAFAAELESEGLCAGECAAGSAVDLLISGDGLTKYRTLFEPFGRVLSEELWNVTGRGLVCAAQDAWRSGAIGPLDAKRHDPAFALPVYTRLSDAEENERIRLASDDPKNLRTGVQDAPAPDGGIGRATMHAGSQLASARAHGIAFVPLDSVHVADVAALEAQAMGSDAWSERLVADELGRKDRTWWIAEDTEEPDDTARFIGYAGGMVVDGDLQVLKVAVAPAWRRRGIARELLVRVAEDARNLGANTCSLEVRLSNEGAQAFYAALGFHSVGVRPHYYAGGEDAVIMQGELPVASHGVAGMELKHLNTASAGAEPAVDASAPAEEAQAASARRSDKTAPVAHHPLILAIESSCDETAAALIDGESALLSDVVASQVDFHARFGGVVPEIASRKHIEAICGVCAEALESAGQKVSNARSKKARSLISWSDLDAVAVTYAPGLLGALVVGVAFAKGAAWALDVPVIGVNHLEGHLYANKVGAADFEPPAVVSLVSGGNTMLVYMRDWGDYETLGSTIDDAVGEAFDKVAKALGLGYPGGPVISKFAAEGNKDAIAFPRALLHSHDLRFSLSGLKTAVVNYINGERQAGRELNIPDIAASFQQAVIDVQIAKARMALEQTGAPTFCLGGGVAANPALREAYENLCQELGVRLVMPPLSSCGDNAGMIALAAQDRYNQRRFFPLDGDAFAHADLDEPY